MSFKYTLSHYLVLAQRVWVIPLILTVACKHDPGPEPPVFAQPDLLNNASFETGWDGFQNNNGGPPDGTGGATIVRSTEQTFGGSWTAKSTLPPGQSANRFNYTYGTRGHVFVRFYYYATNHPTDNHKWIRFQQAGFGPLIGGLFTQDPGQVPHWSFFNSTPGNAANRFDDLGLTLFNSWHYWEIEYDNSNARVRFWHDGVTTVPTVNPTSNNFINGGWLHSGGGPDVDPGMIVLDGTVNAGNVNTAVYYYDRIAISTQRIGP